MLHLAEKSRLSKNQNTTRRPHRIQFAQGTIRPWHPRAIASNVLFTLRKVSKFQTENKSKTHQESLLLLSILLRSGYKKRAEGLNALTHLGPSTACNDKRKQPTPPKGRTAHRQTDIQNTNVAGRCGRKTYRRRERLPRSRCRNCRSFRWRTRAKTLFYEKKYN